MKEKVLIFLLGVFITISVAATTYSEPVYPALPKQVVVKSFRAMFGLESDIKDYIEGMVRQGYIVKSVAMMDDESTSKGIVVMEKY